MDDQYAFLVRGAKLRCDKGSHARKSNLPLCHGVYSGPHPIVHDEDCVLIENIPEFGICSSPTNPAASSGAEIILVAEDGSNVKGIPCTPMPVGKWMNPDPTVKIARNEGADASGGDAVARSYAAALTMDSFLVCAYGGVIYPEESGQEEMASSYDEMSDDQLCSIDPATLSEEDRELYLAQLKKRGLLLRPLEQIDSISMYHSKNQGIEIFSEQMPSQWDADGSSIQEKETENMPSISSWITRLYITAKNMGLCSTNI